MERLDAHDIEKFLVGLGSLLPSEAVRALVEEVRRQRLDGLRFDALMLSRMQPPSFAGVVRPSHMAVLRRCWHAKYGRSGRPPSHASAASLRQSHSAHPVPSEASAASSKRVDELPRSRSASRPRTADVSKKRFTPPPRNSSHTNLSGLTATTAAGSSEAGCSTTTSKGKCPSESSSAAFPPSEKLAPPRHQSMKTSQEVHGSAAAAASGNKTGAGKYGRTRSAGDIDPPLMGNRKPQKFRRPPQVPPLDFSFLYKGREAEQKRREAQQQALAHKAAIAQASKASSEAPTSLAASSSAVGGGGGGAGGHGHGTGNGTGNGLAATLPPGFAAASSEDQRRIAAFYGYREDGFIATMHGLRTDEIRPRLYLGTMADAAYWPLLKALGVTHILNCAVEAQKTRSPYEPHGIRYMLLPLHDSPETAQLLCKQRFRALREATRFIHTCIKTKNQRQGIFIHCVQGLSRSAAIVAAYLMEYEGLPMDRAIQEVRSRHKGCLTSHHWQAMLCKFNTDLLAQS